MRIVLDSSVLIAAHITRAGICAELLEDVLMQHELVTSQHILDAVARKLRDRFGFPMSAPRSVTRFLAGVATKVEPAAVPDIPVLGTALAAEATLLITVDKDLLAVGEFQGIALVKPGEFWRRASG